MNVKIKRIDKTLPLPKYETQGSVGFDILARTSKKVAPGAIEIIPSNLIIQVPDGYMLVIASRSSTPIKKGLTPPHGLGIIDQDYCGPEDEIGVLVRNFSAQEVVVERGEKIAQGVFVKVDCFQWEEIDDNISGPAANSRGGFGSTGGYVKI